MAQAGLDVKRVSLLDVVNAAQSGQEVVARLTCVARLADHLNASRAGQLRGASLCVRTRPAAKCGRVRRRWVAARASSAQRAEGREPRRVRGG